MKKLLATIVLLASATVAQAGTYSVYGVTSAAYTPDFSSSIANPDISINTGTPAVYQVDFYVTYTNGGGDERGFANVLFDINFSGNSLANDTLSPGWSPANPTVDTNGTLPGGNASLFFTNTDAGTEGDLQYILTSIPKISEANTSDPRQHIGEGAGTLLGSIFVDWDGVGTETLNINLGGASYARTTDGFLIYDSNGTLIDTSLTFGVPEPASMGLLGIAALGLLRRRRHA